jgi:TPR repeat protein
LKSRAGVSDAVKRLVAAASGGDLKAMRELGTRFWSGRGARRRIPLAAEYWTIAALAGDKPSAASLVGHLADIADDALGGSMRASLCLAKVYDRGLGVGIDKARMYAWLMWGERHGTRDDDADMHTELLDMRGFYGIMLPDADKDDALDLINEWASSRRRSANPTRTFLTDEGGH